MLLKHGRNYGLGMDALVTTCSWNKTQMWFGHGCSSDRMLLKHERHYGLCSSGRMLLEHECNYGFGMAALVTVCSWNTDAIMVSAWMPSKKYALETRTQLWFGHGCSSDLMLLEHERNYGLGMDALVVCSVTRASMPKPE